MHTRTPHPRCRLPCPAAAPPPTPQQSKTWTEISCEGRVPPPRHSHTIALHRGHMYLFGGLDELGAQSFAMYRLALPPGPTEAYATAKPKWGWVGLCV